MNEFDYLKIKLPHLLYPIEIRGKAKGQLINESNIHLFSPDLLNHDIYTECTVSRLHLTNDVFVEDLTTYINQLVNIPFRKYNVDTYKTGIRVRSNDRQTKGHSTYLTFYNKEIESKSEDYKNILRIENKIDNPNEIRNKLQIQGNDLYSVLTSTGNPIEKIITNIYEDIDNSMTNKHTLKNDIDTQRWDTFFMRFNYDFDKIKNHLKLNKQSRYQINKAYEVFVILSQERNNIDYQKILLPLVNATNEINLQNI